MAVNNPVSDMLEAGDGVTASFAFTFKIFTESDLEVYVDGDLVSPSDYTITISSGEGGTILFDTPPALDAVIYAKRTLAYTQPSEVPNAGPFNEAKTEAMVDRAVMLVQQVLRLTTLAVRIPDGELNDVVTPDSATRANKVLAFDADGDITISDLDLADIEEQPALAEAAQVAATAAAATATTKASEASVSAAAALVSQLAAEAVAAGMKWRPSVRMATTTTLPACTYANGTGGVGATLTGNANGALAAIDGVTPVLADKILVKDQAAPAQNGVYEVTQLGTAGTPFILTRSTDADSWAEFVSQVRAVEEGTTLADTIYICTVNAGGTVGTNSVTWAGISINVPDGTITYIKLAAAAIASGADLIAGTASKLVNAAEFKSFYDAYSRIQLKAAVATTSGTEKDFNSIPAGVKCIKVSFAELSGNGSSPFIVQLGDSGGIETTGYASSGRTQNTDTNATNGFLLMGGTAAGNVYHGIMTLQLIDEASNLWAASCAGACTGAANTVIHSGGHKSLSATLDRVRITTVNGTDAFDLGTVGVSYHF